MAVESAEDLAGMFDVEEFAESALYTAPGGGSAVTCTPIVDRGQGREMFDRGRGRQFDRGEPVATGSERHLWVRKTANGNGGLADVVRDGVFAMLDADGVATGEVFRVAGLPKLDHAGALWSAELVIGS
ncbi:hypothetical protein [Novosphingobium mangrovi (ex Huang et al. 2023)]|uniref:Uncharacterized protein n=1 Tax=Novosphingobium mangrovi (ex Huang et al. 2023) TaxID=2976432 RepID=A0ABT2I140_9SPHN|nr:hypothetical protein [Novosphingobium mangrovi (ex Huang et al. 2023)]MCT2398524.1 hypothetical protein [Novosphingobium mangrovi (ex Huang et al. 2023)]